MLKTGLVASPSLQMSNFNNDAILATSRSSTGIGVTGFTGNSHRYINAADNIILNKDFIANEAVYIMKNRYPYFTVPGGEINCEDDVRDILDALVNDLKMVVMIKSGMLLHCMLIERSTQLR